MRSKAKSSRAAASAPARPCHLESLHRRRADPKTGVYVTRTRDLDTQRAWNSVTNVGYRPTFGDSTQLTIETFLLDPLAGETPRRISVEFLWRVREERKFTNPEALKARILRDAAAARRYFARTRPLLPRPLAPQ